MLKSLTFMCVSMHTYIHTHSLVCERVNVPPSFSNSMHICVMANACVHRFSNKRLFFVVRSKHHEPMPQSHRTTIVRKMWSLHTTIHHTSILLTMTKKRAKENHKTNVDICWKLPLLPLQHAIPETTQKNMIYEKIVKNIERERVKRLWRSNFCLLLILDDRKLESIFYCWWWWC